MSWPPQARALGRVGTAVALVLDMALQLNTSTSTLQNLSLQSTQSAGAVSKLAAPQEAKTAVVHREQAKDNPLAAKARQAAAQAPANKGGKVGGVPMGPWALKSVESKPMVFDMKAIDFSNTAPAISSAQKFIIPVPKFAGGGEPLVYPKGHEKAGQEITDWQGKPIGGSGMVFDNPKDNAVQAVKADGNGVVIINQVSEEQGKKLLAKIGSDPSKLTLEQFKEALAFAKSELGLNDMYNSDMGFINKNMSALETAKTDVPAYGMHRRDARDVCLVSFVEGKGEFRGTGTDHKFDNGAVILKQGDDVRLIQPEIFAQTYTNKDGSAIDLAGLPRQVGPAVRRDYGSKDVATALKDIKDPASMKAYAKMVSDEAGGFSSSALSGLRDQVRFNKLPSAQANAWNQAINDVQA